MQEFIDVFFNPQSAAIALPVILKGAFVTLQLALAIVPLALLLGIVIAVLRDLRLRWLTPLLVAYIDVLRSLPPLVLIIFLYTALPFVGIRLEDFTTVWAALLMNGAAFFAEIVRAGLERVPRSQRDAGRVTGLSELQIELLVLLPQGLRHAVPPIASNTIELVKATALASVVAVPELLRSARTAQNFVYDATPLVMAAAIYLAVLWPLVRLLSRFEQPRRFVRRG